MSGFRWRVVIGLFWLTAGGASFASAQQVALRQPVIGTNAVSTSVMVPDRGRISLGGVSSAQSARRQSGFWPRGSSVGLSRSTSSFSAGVTIIDLREMDEAILNSAPASSTTSSPPQTIVATKPGPADLSPREKAERFERLAREAEARGNLGVAKLHWAMAAKFAGR